nr:hypothetical protein CFP56_71193 [Quercus suber]
MPFHFFQGYNNKGNTSKEIFTKTHKDLVKDGSEWLRSTSESCSVVAALIATVAFASATSPPQSPEALSKKVVLQHSKTSLHSTFVLCNLGKALEFEWGSVFFGRDGFVGLLLCGSCLAVDCGFV